MRRKRFTAELEDIATGMVHERIILAWNPITVEGYYEENRPQDRLLRVTLTPKRRRKASLPMWEPDHSRLLHAYDTLSITWPVQIRRTASRQHQGCHKLKVNAGRTTPTHMIVVDKTLTPNFASRILWHELAHAAQAERASKLIGATTARLMQAAWASSSLRTRDIPYNARPCEVEARQIENKYQHHLLTRLAK